VEQKKNIALFGGSFNPPHEGHLEIVRRVATDKSIDEVWVLPVWKHPFRKKLPNFLKRLKNCKNHFTNSGPVTSKARPRATRVMKKIKIKSYEKHPRATGYTIDLLEYLTKKFPHYRFSWVMGSDTYKQRKKWKRFSELKKMVRFIVFPRGSHSPIPNISSRKIRRAN
jgi:nicotinate-nucleotide adenylyltransferase